MQGDELACKKIQAWLEGPYDAETKLSLQKLLKEDPTAAIDAFYTDLSFGTGGLRGLMGVGTNRMNSYTVRTATQGLANYLNQIHAGPKSVVIGFDSRCNSRFFAEETAKVLAGNGIRVLLFRELRPSPLVSFAIRYKKCTAGIMITASHNPPAYNGYKVFWSDGAQIFQPHDEQITAAIRKVQSPKEIRSVEQLDDPLIQQVSEEIDRAYLETIKTLLIDPQTSHAQGKNLRIVYTSLHGTGITLIPHALQQAGFENLSFIEDQIIPDGNFPTCLSPNPEDPASLERGVNLLKETGSDLLLATDPDADRLGAAVLHQDQVHLLNGNQIACLCLYTILKKQKLPAGATFVKTIATTELFKVICEAYQKPCFEVLTGFKHIANLIRKWENEASIFRFIFGGEESFGYLLGTYTRDKDGITSAVLLAEAALFAQQKNQTLVDLLQEIYQRFGYYYETLHNLHFPETKLGREQIAQNMQHLQEEPPLQILDQKVTSLEDFLLSRTTTLPSKTFSPLIFPKSNALRFWLEDGTKLLIRPSGTEPKIKIYCGLHAPDPDPELQHKAAAYYNFFSNYFKR